MAISVKYRSAFFAVTAACLVGGFALVGVVPASGAVGTGSIPKTAVGTEQVLPADSSAAASDDGFWEENQAPLGTATTAIEEQFPSEFAYAFFDESSAMHVAFASSAPAEAVALLENTGLPYVIVESVGFNAAEYEAATNEVVDQTLSYVTPERQVTVSSDPSAGQGAIVVSFQSDDPELTTDPGLISPSSNARSAGADAVVTVGDPFTVTFDDTNTSPTELMGYGRAGGTWLIDTNGQGQCTSSFVAKSNSSAALGVLTAGHCPNSLRYYNANNGEVQQLTLQSKVLDRSGDAMFQRSPVMMDAWFHYGENSGKPVLAVRNPFDGERVLSYGRTSNYEHTGAVLTLTSVQSNYLDGVLHTVADLVETTHSMQHGDSGGPLYGGNTAMGLLSSGSPDGSKAYYTKIKTAERILNVTVCKDPVCS